MKRPIPDRWRLWADAALGASKADRSALRFSRNDLDALRAHSAAWEGCLRSIDDHAAGELD